MTDQRVEVVVLGDGGDGAPGVVGQEGQARGVVGGVGRHRADEAREGGAVTEGGGHRPEGHLRIERYRGG